jgi:predicted TIM-barrel fold metal-dependent hydrolase
MIPPELEPIPFVDAHHHLWNLDEHRYSWLEGSGDPATTEWLGDYAAIRNNYLVEDYRRDTNGCGLIKSVHVQAGWSRSDSVGESIWLQHLADEYGLPSAIIGDVDLRADDAEEQLERHSACQGFRGVRMMQMYGLVTDSRFRRGFAALSKRGLSYDLNIRVPHTSEATSLARDFPGTIILLGNTGNPMQRTDEYFDAWRREMAELAVLPNVVVKISGLGMSDHSWTLESIRRWVLTAIDLFSPDRTMFASNWPVDGLYSTLPELVRAYRALTASFSDSERNAMFSGNAERYYRV